MIERNNIIQMYKRTMMFWADFGTPTGSEQGGVRPVIIVQNDVGNKYSPTVIVAAITSKINKAKLPTHIEISKKNYPGLDKDSVILLEQQRTLDKRRLGEFIGFLNDRDLLDLDYALTVSSQTVKPNSELDKKINNLVEQIKSYDGFISVGSKSGIDTSMIINAKLEKHNLLCELNFICSNNKVNIKRYYNEREVEAQLECVR